MNARYTASEQERLYQQLEDYLGATIPTALQDESVTELSVNHDGVLRIARMGAGWAITTERFTEARIVGLLSTIATLQGRTIRTSNPILETWVPGYGTRIEGVLPPVVRSPIFSIRRPPSRVFSLDEYVAAGRMSSAACAALRAAVLESRNVLVVGGTGSGKTTLVNALLREIVERWPEQRLAILEDTREIVCQSSAWVQLETTRPEPGYPEVDLEYLLRAALRLNPKRIIVGEVRGQEALSLIRAWNTGHPGGVSTIHANGSEAGLLRLEQAAGQGTARGAVPRSEIVEAVQVVAFVKPGPAGPCVGNVLRVRGATPEGYALEELAS